MVAKAKLVQVRWNPNDPEPRVVRGHDVEVQFNPESLKVTYSNENRGGGQPAGGGGQFVGVGTSKMTIELLFDTTETGQDVRGVTKKVAYFIEPPDPRTQRGNGRNSSSNRVPPGVRFEWGTFLFPGVADSMEETLDYFSEEGVPLRATISLTITRQHIKFDAKEDALRQSRAAPAIEPIEVARQNDSVTSIASRENRSNDWKPIAAANNIDNPRRLQPGSLLNLNARASASVTAAASLQGNASAVASFSAGAGAGISAGSQVGFSAGLGAGTGFGASAGVSAGASAGASAGFNAGASIGAGAGASAAFGSAGSLGASGGVAFRDGVSIGASGVFGASASGVTRTSVGAGMASGATASSFAYASAGVSASASAFGRTRTNISGRIVSPSSLLDI